MRKIKVPDNSQKRIVPETVWFYRNGSKASEYVEDQLKSRNINYLSLWDDSDRPRPAIAIESHRSSHYIEGFSNIQLYFFGALDLGMKF